MCGGLRTEHTKMEFLIADDNASGTAGLMAIATALSRYQDKLKHTIVLQFYSAEEWGLIGSTLFGFGGTILSLCF